MNTSHLLVGTILFTSFLLGCKSEDSGTALSTRLEAAMAIQEVPRKDMNLRDIALAASQAADVEICKKAVEAIANTANADDTAADCLRALRKAGKTGAAVAIAKLIKEQARRDMWLSDLSK